MPHNRKHKVQKIETRQSKPYEINGESYSFSYSLDGKLMGVTQKGANGKFNVATDLNKPIFTSDAAQEAIVESYNHVKYGANTDSYADYNDNGFAKVEFGSLKERNEFFRQRKSKFANQQFIENQSHQLIPNLRVFMILLEQVDLVEVLPYHILLTLI